MTEETNGATEAVLPPAEASIELADFSFVTNGLTSGEHLIRVSNTGTEPHEVVFHRLKEGKTFAEVQALLDREMSGEEISDAEFEAHLEDGGGVTVAPAKVSYSNVTLEPGDYILVCYLPSEAHEGKSHYELGMVQQLTIE